MKIVALIVLFSLKAWCAKELEIVVNAPSSTPLAAVLFLSGNTDELCQWKADCLPLLQIGVGVYHAFLHPAQGSANIEFKVTRGSWDTEAADEGSKKLSNFQLSATSFTSPVLINLVNWKDFPPLGVTGRVDHIDSFYSPELINSRGISIWLPPHYATDLSSAYPVIYMHDGENLFDPLTSFAGVDWGIDETLTSLIEQKAVKPAIVVGIYNTADRNAEYDYSVRGKEYAEFLIHTLKPFIDSHYRTNPDRDHTFTMGSSMGALISLSLLWTHPEIFSKAAGLSLPAFANNQMIINMVNSVPAPKQPIKFYFDHGDQGQDANYGPSCELLNSSLTKSGIPGANINLAVYPYANHSELDWSRRVFIPLEFLLKDLSP